MRRRSVAFHFKDADAKTTPELLIAKQEAVTSEINAEINKLEADKDRIEAISKVNALVHRIKNPTPIVSARIKSTIQQDRKRAEAPALINSSENSPKGNCK